MTLICLIWVLVFFDFHLFVQSQLGGGLGFGRVLLILSLPALLVSLQYARPSDLYWPLLLFTALHLTAWPIAHNRGLVQHGFIDMVRVSIVFTATVALFKTPDQILWLVKLFLLSFVWFGFQGLSLGGKLGGVGWHPGLGNPDGFGGFMVIGIGAGFSAIGSSSPRLRYLGYSAFGLGLVGVVASFARGAVVGAAFVLLLLWLRSPRKLITLGAGFATLAVLIPAIEIIHPGGEFWREMGTISEGTSSGTGQGRKRMWGIGLRVWKERPVFGVGSGQAGIIGSKVFEHGELKGKYVQPGRLYSRGLHNTFIQILAEQGVVGSALWLLMLAGFLLRLRRLRSPGVVAAWNRAVGGQCDLYRLTVGLELAMVGFLVGAFFYNEAYKHWFYTLVVLAFLLDRGVTHASPTTAGPASASC